ncbi:MAG: alpha/beta fold hydrolase [Gammaproteobacteria bacterium]
MKSRIALFSITALLAFSLFAIGAEKQGKGATTGELKVKDGSLIVNDDLGSGAPILVFIHCWSCNRHYWKNPASELSKDHRLVLIDLPGHGDSKAGNRPPITVNAMAQDVAAVMDHLDLKDAILIGSSMGEPIALEVARMRPQRVRGIVGVDNLHDVEIQYPKAMFEKAASEMEVDYAKAVREFIPSMFAPEADPKVVAWTADQAATSCEPRVCILLFRNFPTLELKKMMKTAKVPIRNINALPYSTDSEKTNVEVNRKYADFDAVEIDDVGHFIMLEKPQEFNASLRRQIRAVLEASKK